MANKITPQFQRSSFIIGLAACVMGLSWLATPVEAQSPPGPSLEIQMTGSQQFSLNLSGMTGEMYQIETSSNLVDWVPLLVTNSVTSKVALTMSVAAGLTSGFYQAVDLGRFQAGRQTRYSRCCGPIRPVSWFPFRWA